MLSLLYYCCSGAETWSKLGDGYCFAGGDPQEEEYRITDWTIQTLESALNACEADRACVGIHYDQYEPGGEGDYVLLNRLGTPNNAYPIGRRACYKLRENPELPGMYS